MPRRSSGSSGATGETFFYTGHMLHGGGANVTEDRSRRLIATVWSLPFLIGEEAWPFIFSVDEVREFPPRLQTNLGFRSMCYRGEEPGFRASCGVSTRGRSRTSSV